MKLSKEILEETKQALEKGLPFLHLKGNFHLTKTEPNYCDVLLERDLALEHRTLSYVEQKAGSVQLLNRYKAYDPNLDIQKLPPHYAMKVVSGAGSICSGANIFMFFPMVLGLNPASRDDSFGFEFVDIWKNIFHSSIFPCVREVFTLESQVHIHLQLNRELERTIFLAAVFHELGHEVGPWRVSPSVRPDMHLDGYELDVLGELSTDSLMILHLSDFTELPLFIILQRLFWFTRRGFKENPLVGQLNSDNDAWIGVYLWKKLLQHQVFTIVHDRLSYNPYFVGACFQEIIQEIDTLFVASADKEAQRKLVRQWQRKSAPDQTEEGQYCYPPDLQAFLGRCQNIVEVPQFFPTFNYNQINQIKGLCS